MLGNVHRRRVDRCGPPRRVRCAAGRGSSLVPRHHPGTADLDTFATALRVRVDDLLKTSPERAPVRPVVGIALRISDAELLTPAVMQALLGFTSQAAGYATPATDSRCCFPYLPLPPGDNKRLRALEAR